MTEILTTIIILCSNQTTTLQAEASCQVRLMNCVEARGEYTLFNLNKCLVKK